MRFPREGDSPGEGADASTRRASACCTAPNTTFAITPTVSTPTSICTVTRMRASWVRAVMSPKPTVAKVVVVKYSPSVRLNRSEKAPGCCASTVQ
jgi:hypothetical protein